MAMYGKPYLPRRLERLLHGDDLQGTRAHLRRDIAAQRGVLPAGVHQPAPSHVLLEPRVEAAVHAHARFLQREEAADELRGRAFHRG